MSFDFDSSAEEDMRSILVELGYVVKDHKHLSDMDPANTIYAQVPFKRMRLDFALLNAQIAIEVQGDYWHGNAVKTLNLTQAKNKQRDERKAKSLNKEGWKLIKVWEKDVVDRRSRAKSHIKSSILKLIDV